MVNEPADSVARNVSRYPLRATLGVAHRPRSGARDGQAKDAGPNRVVPRFSPPPRHMVRDDLRKVASRRIHRA